MSTDPAEPSPDHPVVDDFTPPPDAGNYLAWPPASRAPATGRARWRLLGLIAGGIGGSALLAVACGVALTFAVRSTDNDLSQPTDPPTFSQPTVSPFAGVYPKPSDLCMSADFTRMHPLFPRVSGLSDGEATEPATGARVATCSGGTSGGEGDSDVGSEVGSEVDQVSGEFQLEAAVFGDVGVATDYFERGHDVRGGADLAGIGQAAYTFVDTSRGPSVTVRDYNLIITMSWRPATAAALPDSLITTMANVCRSSLVVLRIG